MLPKAAEVGLADGAVRCAPPSWAGGEEADLKASPSSGIDLDAAMLANRLGLGLGLGFGLGSGSGPGSGYNPNPNPNPNPHSRFTTTGSFQRELVPTFRELLPQDGSTPSWQDRQPRATRKLAPPAQAP